MINDGGPSREELLGLIIGLTESACLMPGRKRSNFVKIPADIVMAAQVMIKRERIAAGEAISQDVGNG